MLKEIQIISNGGLPLLTFNSDEEETSEQSFLQAGFLTAVSDFSKEVNNGNIKLIETDSVSYLMKKNTHYTSVFTFNGSQESFAEEQKSLIEVNKKILEELGDKDYSPADFNKEINQEKIERLGEYLSDIKFNDKQPSRTFVRSHKILENLESLIYKSVGYVPGQCNIGKEGRLERLTYGLITFIVSLSLLLTMVVLDLPVIYRGWLFLLNAGGFVCVLQYFYKFCIVNGAVGKYEMETTSSVGNISGSGQIEDRNALKEDRLKVVKIIVQSIVLGALLTLTFLYIPSN